VSKPSVNQSYTGASRSKASWRLPWDCHRRARLVAARSSQRVASGLTVCQRSLKVFYNVLDRLRSRPVCLQITMRNGGTGPCFQKEGMPFAHRLLDAGSTIPWGIAANLVSSCRSDRPTPMGRAHVRVIRCATRCFAIHHEKGTYQHE
jgi:hypothetical protein